MTDSLSQVEQLHATMNEVFGARFGKWMLAIAIYDIPGGRDKLPLSGEFVDAMLRYRTRIGTAVEPFVRDQGSSSLEEVRERLNDIRSGFITVEP